MIAITGTTGLLGAHLAYALLEQGHQIKALKRKHSSTKLLERIFSYYTNEPEELMAGIHWSIGDVNDISSLEDFLNEGDLVYHCAGYVSFEKSKRAVVKQVNVEGTANLVDASLHKNVSKLVHASSIAALGRASEDGMISERSKWKNSKRNTWYAVTKMLGEQEVWRGQMEGLKTAIVNPGIILGPGPWENGSSKLFTTVWNGLKYYTPGVNGYVDVRDVAKAMVLLMASEIESERFVLVYENINYQSFFTKIASALNVEAPSKQATPFMAELAWRMDAIRSFLAQKSPMITKETARTAMKKHYYDGSKIEKQLNFKYRSLEDTIAHTANCFLADQKS